MYCEARLLVWLQVTYFCTILMHTWLPCSILSLYFVRRAFDVERRLDRIECSVIQYADEGERGVVPVIDVVVRVALFLPRSFPIFQNPVDVSG